MLRTVARDGRHRAAVLLALVVAAMLLVTGAPSPAPAAPAPATDPEGGTPQLRQSLASASKGFADAQARLFASRRRQGALVIRRNETEARAAVLSRDVDELAAAAYRDGRVGLVRAALGSESIPSLLDRSQLIDAMSSKNQAKIDALARARAELEQQRRALDREIALQTAQQQAMAKRKADAERALRTVGGGAGRGLSASSSGTAAAAPRAADGSLASQSCSVDDPTSTGCLTPRTLHALQQARAAGFTRFTACFRQASFGEHQKGRACDFSAAPSTFGGVATGDERNYGDRLAAYFVNNAERLGVLYVIWFKEIWLPGTGWRAYNGGNGDPASDHTNHVHLSVQ
jgi:hypothetical protein